MDKILGSVEGLDPELQTTEDLQRRDAEVKLKGASIPGFSEMSEKVEREMMKVNADMDEGIRIESKFRRAGFLPSEAHDLIKIMRSKKIGQIYDPLQLEDAQPKLYALTPFNTVVEAQLYIDVLQKQVIDLSKMVNNSAPKKYTFSECIRMAFKILLKRA